MDVVQQEKSGVITSIHNLTKDYYAFGHGALAPYIRKRLKPSRPKKAYFIGIGAIPCGCPLEIKS